MKNTKTKQTAFKQNITWLVLLFAAALLLLWAVKYKEAEKISQLVVNIEALPDDNNLLSKEDILERLKKTFVIDLQGMPIGNLDIKKVEAVLEEDPFVLDAEAYISADNKIHIQVKQRIPILRIMDDSGDNYYLDKDGKKMPLSQHFSAKVLVATGSIPPHVPDFQNRPKHVLRDLFALANKIMNDDFLEPMIAQIHRNEKGIYSLVPLVGNHKIIFGTYESVDDKFFRLEQFYLKAIPYKGWNKYKTINLTFKNQVVCEKR